jgi:hypothetical protein
LYCIQKNKQLMFRAFPIASVAFILSVFTTTLHAQSPDSARVFTQEELFEWLLLYHPFSSRRTSVTPARAHGIISASLSEEALFSRILEGGGYPDRVATKLFPLDQPRSFVQSAPSLKPNAIPTTRPIFISTRRL